MKRNKKIALLSGICIITLLTAACSARENNFETTANEQANIISESQPTSDITHINSQPAPNEVTATDINELSAETESNNYSETSPIVIVQIYENYAWGFEQEVTIIDADGYCYYFECSGEGVDDSEKINLHGDDNWYNNLTQITNTESIGQIEENITDTINKFSYDFEQYKEYPIKEYSNYLRDYGNYYLYGIYIDDNNEPQYIMLSQYGNNIKCIDDDNIINFVNQMIDSNIFYTQEYYY